MDIRINALGRSIELIGIECDTAEDCTAVALDLWQSLVIAPEEEIGGAIGIQLERGHQKTGFAFLGDGERLEVK